MPRILPLVVAALAAHPAFADVRLDLRYRYESVDDEAKPGIAEAGTLRARLRLATPESRGFSAYAEVDRVQAIGGGHYDDTRNGDSNYAVVADPEGTDLNQAWLQYRTGERMRLRIGRQRISHGNERFVGSVGWRQNEQTFDAISIASEPVRGAAIEYAFVDRVLRVFGPEAGVPPDELGSDSHFLRLSLTSLPAGVATLYRYRLDFANAPQLSSDTAGVRYDGNRPLTQKVRLGWAIDYARQRDAGGNAARIDAHYLQTEVSLATDSIGVSAGLEILSGERGSFTPETNPAFQTPLATLHVWQGWADRLTTTPPAGIEDRYVGLRANRAGWSARAMWHDFDAEATAADYGREWDLSLARKLKERYELLLKYADYSAGDFSSDTRKFWLQLSAAF